MTTFERLAQRVKKDLDIDLINLTRCFPGYWQRAQGAWVWCAQAKGIAFDYGSSYSATDLLKEKSPLTILDHEIMPST